MAGVGPRGLKEPYDGETWDPQHTAAPYRASRLEAESERSASPKSVAKRGDEREPEPRKTMIWRRQETGRERRARPQTRMSWGR